MGYNTMIPIYFENDDKARLITDGERFTIQAHLDKVDNPKYWHDDASYGWCHRYDDVDITELIGFLPQISEYIGFTVEITEDSSTYYTDKRHKVELLEIPVVTYRVIIDNKCVFKKNTIKNGSVSGLRSEVVKWVARLLYDYEIFRSEV